MKSFFIIGVFLIIAGVIALTYQGFHYTTQEKALAIGPVQVTTEKNHNVPFAPIVGITLLICGAGMVVMGFRRAD